MSQNGNAAPPPQRHHQGDAWDPRAYLTILRARRGPFAGVTCAIVLLTTVVTFALRPIYRATSLVLLEPKSMNVAKVEGVYDPIMAGMALNDYYKTQFEILRSRRIIEPVASELKVLDRPEFRTEREPLEAFTSTVSIDPIRESRLVRVGVESYDGEFATAAANAIVEQFVDENNERTLGISDTGLKKLKDMERSLRPKYESAAKALQEFKDSNSIYFVDETQSIAVQQLKELTEALSKARADRAKAAAEAIIAESVLKDGRLEGPLPEFIPSRSLDDLKIELSKAEQDRDDLLKHYTSDHPATRAAEARVARVREHVELESRSLLLTLQKRLAAEDERLTGLEAAVEKADTVVAGIGRKAVRLQFLKEEADTIAASYKNVARRIEEVEVAIATGTKENNLFVIDKALVPKQPIRPKKAMNLILGALVGILCGFFFCLLLERLDQTIHGKEDAERLLPYPLLGFVPRVEASDLPATPDGRPVRIELIAIHEPRGEVAEAFRTIRTGLGFTLPNADHRALIVTSATPGDGKSFVSVNLAYSLAQTGKRVLLVDADLRRPRIHEIFELDGSASGLSTTIVGPGEPTLQAIQKTSCPTLDVLPAGPLPPNPAELLGGRGAKALIDRALQTYDWVILDAPPLAAVADPAILLGHVRYAIFVLRAFATAKAAAARAREILEQSPGTVAGIVLNTVDAPSTSSEYGRYGRYRYYHSRSKETAPS